MVSFDQTGTRHRDGGFWQKAAVLCALAVVGFGLGSRLRSSAPDVSLMVDWPGQFSYTASATTPVARSGVELAFIFVGSSVCGWSNHPTLPGVIDDAKAALADHAASEGIGFSATGIAADWDAEEGMRFLRRFGSFHEVSSGRGWANTMVYRYVWQELPGRAATPQVVVSRRRFSAEDDRRRIAEDVALVRLVGLGSIRQWAEAGFPTDTFPTSEVADAGAVDSLALSVFKRAR